MSCWPSSCLLLLAATQVQAAGDGFMVGGGVEVDGEQGNSAALVGGAGLGEDTWLSAELARSKVVLASGVDLETLYGDLELDHFFSPVGVRLGAATWGDSEVLNSRDLRASLYWRGDHAMLSANFETRDFELTIPATDLFPGRQVRFDADGFGLTFRFDVGDTVDLRLAGTRYDYSVPFRPIENRDILRLISASRLSLLNSLDDYRASVTLGIEDDMRRWEIDAASSKSAVSRARTGSYTLRCLLPASDRTDVELALGYDRAESYGDVTYFSFYLYFYGLN